MKSGEQRPRLTTCSVERELRRRCRSVLMMKCELSLLTSVPLPVESTFGEPLLTTTYLQYEFTELL